MDRRGLLGAGLLGAGVAGALVGAARDAFAQGWPARPIRLVVPYPPGAGRTR